MEYKNIVKGTFIKRPNRFIAHVLIDGKVEICHVKNTGRCKELLIPDTTVFLEKSSNPLRKTAFDLISVYKGDRLVNMDSQAPNKVACEWLKNRFPHAFIKSEKVWEDSRFDFYIENGEDRIFVEVKGVTLENNGVALFPDAPTARGVKHLNGLARWATEGNKAMVLFIIQMNGIKYFTPNKETHPEFAEALAKAKEQGVKVVAVGCEVGENTLTYDKEIEIKF